ncbi:MAG: glycosyltransferase family 4 protein [Verrucomicrobiales bacterium]|nr:glycosyltransferase family 4 protein [Verrucomicrobiales bacterium]
MSRVLILVENLPVPLDRRVWQEAGALRDAGYDVTVICPRMRGWVQPEEVREGIRIYRYWIPGEAGSLGGFFAEYAAALVGSLWCSLKARRDGDFEVIHLCNPPDILFLVALPWRLLTGSRVIFDVHDLWPEMFAAKFSRRNPIYWLTRLAERATLALADAVIATNESVREVVMRRGRKREEEVLVVRTAPNRMDLDAPEDLELKKGRRYLVGYIGVMGDADGVEFLIRAAHHLTKELGREDVQFLLMGTGPDFSRLQALRDELGLADYVDMPGRVTDAFLFRALRTIDLGVGCDPINEYNHHCTMNKTLEYMAFGKAQVLFDLKEGRFSAGDAALYVKENDAAQLAEGMVELLDDEPRRREMGRIGQRRLAEQLGWERSVAALKTAYQRARRSAVEAGAVEGETANSF